MGPRRGAVASIFLSYAREDQACAERLAHVLELARHDVWWDRHIGTGHEFSAEIEAALEKCDIVLVAWSKHAARSPWVRDEAASGRDRGRMFPIIIDGSQAPIGFRQFQALDLTGWKGREKDPRTKQLIDALDGQLSGKPAQFGRPVRRFGWKAPAVWSAVAALLLIVGVVTAVLFQGRDRQSGLLSKPSIGLLPFTTQSSDAELRQLGSQARDSVAHTFAQSGLPLRLMDSAKQNDSPPVDFFISGDLSRNGDMMVATVRLDEATHGVTVFSHRFEVPRQDVRDLPERIGAQMAGNLTWRAPLMMLDRQRPIEPAMLADLLQGENFAGDSFGLKSYQIRKRVAAKAPDLQIAQISLAFQTAFVLDQIPREERAHAVAEARRAADRAIALGPDFGDTYGAWCGLQSETRMAECEDRLKAGRRIDPDAPFLNMGLGNLLRNVGRFDESVDLTRMSYSHDTYVPIKIAWMLRTLEYAGERDEARELYQQGARWWPEFKVMFFRNRLFGLLDRGDFNGMEQLEQEIGANDLIPGYRSSATLAAALKTKSILMASKTCPATDGFLLNIRCMLAFSILGDQDRAYKIADVLYPRRIGRTPVETERIWLDSPYDIAPLEFIASRAAASLRRDPRYVSLAERVGLRAYWRSGRPPDFCRKEPEPICKRLMARN